MLEKVAKALFNAEYGDGRQWDDMASEIQAYWCAQARAAIEAMRQPDEAMMREATALITSNLRYEEGYRRMIEAALAN